MIGPLLAARYIGKKPWTVSAVFFVAVLILGIIASTILPANFILMFVVGLAIFLGVAFYYLKIQPVWLGLTMFIASWIINIIISFILVKVGIAIPW